MSRVIRVGDLVGSNKFEGTGKILSLDLVERKAKVGFFESPLNPESRVLNVDITTLRPYILYEESIIYCVDHDTHLWRRARYGGPRPNDMHLVIFRKNESVVVTIEEIFVLNLSPGDFLRPADFLASCANDAMYFASYRERFVKAYIKQRGYCKSISAIPSSSVELEPHQIAVVKRVLQDSTPKYLLADEVGLGKTIEAGIIIREHLLEKKHAANVLVLVPQELLGQWSHELTFRFHLGELFDLDNDDLDLPLKIYSNNGLVEAIRTHGNPTLIVVDEAHQISEYAWSLESNKKELFWHYSDVCQKSEAVLLLSGTPLNGNEKNFLATLHLLNPEAYSITDEGVSRFMSQVEEREKIGGLYSALTVDSNNLVIEGILDQLATLFPLDLGLINAIDLVRPHVDFLAIESGNDRDLSIKNLRKYIGDNYRLHQRMLRNRRENSGLAMLFPGLSGLIKSMWNVDSHDITLDELLEDYRSLVSESPNLFCAMSADLYLDWVDDFLASPLCLRDKALKNLNLFNGKLLKVEEEILIQLVQVADREQSKKDEAFSQALVEWLKLYPDGKAVIFCGKTELSLHVYKLLKNNLTNINVELLEPKSDLEFSNPDNNIRVLVCDHHGEDGLNLHGGRKIAVHYGLTRSCSRIEQRLGRLNRYSANLKAVKPVKSLVVLPSRVGLMSRWVGLLDEVVELFDRTVASLQYVLDEHLNRTWLNVSQQGLKALDESMSQLSGENGLLALERKKVKVQEELLAMDEEVSLAANFADQMIEADEFADEQAREMSGWITDVLQFKKVGSLDNIFHFLFRGDGDPGARTLIDVRSFISTCLNGIEMNGQHSASTSLMSASRNLVAGYEEVFPFRFGQPFVDSIWNLMQTDSRGSSTAYLRFFNKEKFPEIRICFRLGWLVTASKPNASYIEKRLGDDIFFPEIKFQWLREDGQPVEKALMPLLELPYSDSGVGYSDKSLRANVWKELSNMVPSEGWRRTVLEVEKLGGNLLMQEIDRERNLNFRPNIQLISMHATLLCSRESFPGLVA